MLNVQPVEENDQESPKKSMKGSMKKSLTRKKTRSGSLRRQSTSGNLSIKVKQEADGIQIKIV